MENWAKNLYSVGCPHCSISITYSSASCILNVIIFNIGRFYIVYTDGSNILHTLLEFNFLQKLFMRNCISQKKSFDWTQIPISCCLATLYFWNTRCELQKISQSENSIIFYFCPHRTSLLVELSMNLLLKMTSFWLWKVACLESFSFFCKRCRAIYAFKVLSEAPSVVFIMNYITCKIWSKKKTCSYCPIEGASSKYLSCQVLLYVLTAWLVLWTESKHSFHGSLCTLNGSILGFVSI